MKRRHAPSAARGSTRETVYGKVLGMWVAMGARGGWGRTDHTMHHERCANVGPFSLVITRYQLGRKPNGGPTYRYQGRIEPTCQSVYGDSDREVKDKLYGLLFELLENTRGQLGVLVKADEGSEESDK